MTTYQKAWDWIKGNKNAPFTSVLYVASVALIVKVKNIFSESKHDVMVEVYRPGEEAPFTMILLPKICITRYKSFEEHLVKFLKEAIITV